MGLFSGANPWSGGFRYNEDDSHGVSLHVNPDAQKRQDKRQAKVARMSPRQLARDKAARQRAGEKVARKMDRDIKAGKYDKSPNGWW